MFKLSCTLTAATAAAAMLVLGAGGAAAHGGAHGFSFHSSARAPSGLSRPAVMAQMHTSRGSGGSSGSGGMRMGGGGGSITVPTGGGGGNTGPPPVTLPQPSTGPSSTLGPMQPLQPIPPLAQPLPTQIEGGGTATNLALSPGSSGSPSESAPSAPGGGGKTLADCMGFWDKATHMSKPEWRAACKRTMAEHPTIR